MQFEILGPLRVTDAVRPVTLTGHRRRILLVALLSHPNAVVSTAELVEWLWPSRPPRAALTTLHAHMSMLRGHLEPHRPPWQPSGRLHTRAPGYLLQVGGDELDVLVFERLLHDGRRLLRAGDPEQAQARLSEALALWRGAPLSDAAHVDAARAEIARLDELRLNAVTLRVEANLALRRHQEIVPELTHLVAKHPLHERFYVQLMIALSRSGRRADAIAVYHRARAVLARELAVAPGRARCRPGAAGAPRCSRGTSITGVLATGADLRWNRPPGSDHDHGTARLGVRSPGNKPGGRSCTCPRFPTCRPKTRSSPT